jgi:hypothetical protein
MEDGAFKLCPFCKEQIRKELSSAPSAENGLNKPSLIRHVS